jgi:hypothetical protein
VPFPSFGLFIHSFSVLAIASTFPSSLCPICHWHAAGCFVCAYLTHSFPQHHTGESYGGFVVKGGFLYPRVGPFADSPTESRLLGRPAIFFNSCAMLASRTSF